MLKTRLTAWLRPVFTLFALGGLFSLAACGGGNGAPNNPYASGGGPLTVLPATTTIFSGVPATLTITGGTAPYQAFSSNSTVLPVTQAASTTIPLLAATVTADTSVTITIRDAAGTSVSAAVTVSPSLLLPASITITGDPVCASSGSDLCSGQDGTASVQITGPASLVAGRQVRFDVVLGTYSLIALNSTVPAQSVTVLSDQNGLAVVTIRVPSTALTQFATLRATDVASGSTVVGQFTIAQFVNGTGVLSIIPTGTTTFTGPDTAHCASSGIAAFYIFGGTPPYTVQTTFPGAVTLSGTPVLASGGGFTITPTGGCFTGMTFAITDATGRTLLNPPTVSNVLGTAAPTPPDVLVTPSTLSGTCKVGQSFSFLATGGTGTFTAAITPKGTITVTPATATFNPVASPGTGGAVTVSFTSDTPGTSAVGAYTLTVSSGTAKPGTATLTCI